jgi:N-acetylmuramoyl-L-alanine amidase
VLSIHHNALPDGRDPLAHIGASTYYYHPFARPLAEMLLASLSEPGGLYEIPCYGLLFDSLQMTRIHQALAVLVEVGFFTHPQEYARLIQPEFQQEVARRLARGLAEYCENLA